MTRAPKLDRLKPQDLMLVLPEEEGWPQDIGALAILDGARLIDAEGRFKIDVARRRIAERLHLLPRFRQVLERPGVGLGWPFWTDAAGFNIDDHVGVMPVPSPGGERELLEVCERLRRRSLDYSRPLWEMWFLTGLPEQRIGFFMKLHHAIADGITGIAALGAFVDATPDAPAAEPPAWAPLPPPTRREVFRDNVRGRLDRFDDVLTAVAHPVAPIRRMREYWPATYEIFFEERAPRTSFNRRIGSDRRLAIIRSRLTDLKDVAHAHGATVNDVLIAGLAGGYRELLRGRGETPDVLRAFVPVSLHRQGSGAADGNLDAGMLVPFSVEEADPFRRLELIARETSKRKKKARPQAGSLFRNVLLQRAFFRMMPRQRFMNAYVANIPGPSIEVYFAGTPIRELFPIVPLTANVSIGAGALSYAGQFNITIVSDRDLVPDVDVLVRGTREALDRLTRSVALI
jgi:diacylglycerol O-acyltransferase / wax synthase